MITVAPTSMIARFFAVEDPRVERTKRHLLINIIVIAICGIISGADDWVAIEAYGNAKLDWFREFLDLPHGIPSHDTFGRVFARIKPDQFQQCFRAWIQDVCKLNSGEDISIDGKILCNSCDSEIDQNPIQMVSAWAVEQQLVLAQVKADKHSNEITAIPTLLNVLDIAECVVSIDAAGCQTEIATQIHTQGGDYVLAVKGNQPTLHHDIKALFQEPLAMASSALFTYSCSETRDHGRIETRQCWVTAHLDSLSTKSAWTGLQTVALIRSERYYNGNTTTEQRYYISSLPPNAERISRAVRSHWGIENLVHWVLDVAFREDYCRVRKDHGPHNLAILRHVALNLLRHETSLKAGIKTKRLRAGWDNNYLRKVLKSLAS